jgi:hypothetical protein
MASSTIVQPATARTLKVGGIVSGPTIDVDHAGETDGQQLYGFGHASANAGVWFDTLGGGGGGYGVVVNRHYTAISDFIPGRQFQQYAINRSRVAPFLPYVKTSAGTQTLTADPSTDGANWTLLSATTGPSLFNGNELIDTSVNLYGANPATISWLGEALGTAMTLTGRPANGTAASDANLRVNGTLSAEGLLFNNSINHLEDPCIGGGQSNFVLGNNYYFPLGVPTIAPPGGVAPARFNLPGNVFPAATGSQSTIFTLASDPASTIMVTSGEAAGTSPAVGVLSVPKSPLSKTATFFVVQSLDPANGNLSVGDVSTFQWVILNPAW